MKTNLPLRLITQSASLASVSSRIRADVAADQVAVGDVVDCPDPRPVRSLTMRILKPSHLRIRVLLCAAILFFAGRSRAEQVAVPPLEHQVTDQVHVLSSDQHDALEAKLAAYQAAHGTQIAVLLMSSTAPETMDQYGIRVFDAWKLGHLKINDGLLLIVAKDNPHELGRMRIEVGRGLEGAITDVQAKRVLDNVIAPQLHTGDFAGGLNAGVDKLTSLLDADRAPIAVPAPLAAEHGMTDVVIAASCLITLLSIIGAIVLLRRSRSEKERLAEHDRAFQAAALATSNRHAQEAARIVLTGRDTATP